MTITARLVTPVVRPEIRPAQGATTVLATVEPCSEPDRVSFSRYPATTPACPGGAMFPRHAVGGGTRRGFWRTAATSLEHRSTQASCVVAGRRFWGDAFLVPNIARRRQAPPWRRYLRRPDPAVPVVVGFDGVCPLSQSRNRTTCASSRERGHSSDPSGDLNRLRHRARPTNACRHFRRSV